MSTEIERILGNEHLVKGVAIIPYDEAARFKNSESSSTSNDNNELHEIFPNGKNSKISYLYGACHNLPDLSSVKATKRVLEMCTQLKENDILLTLISGGGSALLSQPIDLCGNQDDRENLALKLATIKSLVISGADINDLNTVS